MEGRSGQIVECQIFVVVWNLCFSGGYVDELASFLAFSEDNNTVDESEQGVVLAHAHVEARVVNRTALTLDNVACLAVLTTENLYAEAFAF